MAFGVRGPFQAPQPTRSPGAVLMSIRHALVAAASLALAACAGPGGYRVNADVRSFAAGSHDSSGLTTASNAKVDLGRTDESGALHAEGTGVVPLSCNVVVGRAGSKVMQYKVSEICKEQNTEGCRELAFKAILPAAT